MICILWFKESYNITIDIKIVEWYNNYIRIYAYEILRKEFLWKEKNILLMTK